jgi:hypothetical protein
MQRIHYVVPARDGGWDVRQEGEFERIRHYEQKEQAVEFARRLSELEETELVIEDESGDVESKAFYGTGRAPDRLL